MRVRLKAIGVASAVCVLLLGTLSMGAPVAGAAPGAQTIDADSPQTPAVSGSRVVWADDGDGDFDILLYEADTGVTSRIANDAADEISPAIYGDTVVYVSYASGSADIYAYDIPSKVTRALCTAAYDQLSPSVSGRWVVWEDYRSGYNPGIYGYDLQAGGEIYVESGYNQPKRRPRVSGDLVCWEDYSGRSTGRLDPDVVALDLASGMRYVVAATTAPELVPATDGRRVAYAVVGDKSADIACYDTATGLTSKIRRAAGEQTLPQLGDGVVYWLDLASGSPAVQGALLTAAGAWRIDTREAGSVSSFAASGRSAAWLTKTDSGWAVRASFSAAPPSPGRYRTPFATPGLYGGPFARLGLRPIADRWAPEVERTSIRAGATQVKASAAPSIRFSEPLDASSVSAATVSLTDQTGAVVPAQVRYSALTRSVTVRPADPLREGTYRLTVSGAVRDRAGNALGEDSAIVFSTLSALADIAPPTNPGSPMAAPSGTSNVNVTWKAAVDYESGVANYFVYRTPYPGSALTTVAVVGSSPTSATFAAAADENVPKKYTYYYAVRARDASGNLSGLSAYVSPDPHGTYVAYQNTNNCMMCHSPHGATLVRGGALGARSLEACYSCHGGTPSTTAYGAASTIDVQGLLGEDSVISTGPNTASGGSVHRNSYLRSTRTECVMCHTPHRKPYNENPPGSGSKEASTSYSKLLRRAANRASEASGQIYSKDSAPFDKVFCFDCHGTGAGELTPGSAPYTWMYINGGSTAYDSAGGDHEVTYDSGAHRSAFITAGPRPSSDPGPDVVCYACHAEHKSAANGLTDYRRSGTTQTTYMQSGLCFECHATFAEGADETRSAGSLAATRPYTWNGRSVKAEFARRSKHPYAAPVAADPVPVDGSWEQSTTVDFGTDSLDSLVTTPYANGSVELEALFGPDVNETRYLYTTSDIAAGSWTANTGNRWDAINDPAGAPDDLTTYIVGGGTTAYQAASTVPTVPANATNITVTLFYRYRSAVNGSTCNFVASWRHNGTWYTGTTRTTASSTWATDSDTLANPAGGAWTPADVNQLDGLGADTSDTTPWCTQIYFEVTYDVPGAFLGYRGTGDIVSTPIVVSGTHYGWQDVVVNASIPSQTTMTLDILDAADDSVIHNGLVLANGTNTIPISWPGATGVNHGSYPSIKLRADFTGDVVVPVPRSVSDDFDDNSFDTATPVPKWYDTPTFGGATDPDYVAPTTYTRYTYSTADIAAGSWTVNTGNRWDAINDPAATPDDLTTYIIGGNTTEYQAASTVPTVPANATNITVELFYRFRSAVNGSTCNYIPRWRQNGTWRSGTTRTTSSSTWQTQSDVLANPAGGAWTYTAVNLIDGIGADTSDTTPWCTQMYFEITYDVPNPPTDIWPREATGNLTLRAEGAGFTGTSDEGGFAYQSSADTTWFAGPWEMESKVETPAAWAAADGKAGIMVRTAATSANATAGGSPMVGLYVTRDNGVRFQYRTTAGGAMASAGQAASISEPVWLKIEYDGANGYTGWYSTDGSAWTQVGGSVTVAENTVMLLGPALTSTLNGTYAEAIFDEFSVTEQLPEPLGTKTPRLDDWRVTYRYVPAPAVAVGELTCVNCHNTHAVQTGPASSSWSTSRVVDPHDTQTLWSSTGNNVSAFCMACHDSTAPSTSANSASVWVPYNVSFTSMGSYPFFPGWNKAATGIEWANSGHAAASGMSMGCDNCHDPHGSATDRITAYTRTANQALGVPANPRHNTAIRRDNTTAFDDEKLCFGCHAVGASVTVSTQDPVGQMPPSCTQPACHPRMPNIYSVIATTPYSHAVTSAAMAGRHTDTETAAQLGTSNRHVECADCHNVHAARTGTHTPNTSKAGPTLRGAIGVRPSSWPSNWTSPTAQYGTELMDGGSLDDEALVCFKCHSRYTTLPTSGGSGGFGATDLAFEFNPNNQSGHNVLSDNFWPKTSTTGTGTYSGLPYTFGAADLNLNTALGFSDTPATYSSQHVTCSDCHAYDAAGARGPHGSGSKFMLDPYAANQTGDWWSTTLNGWGSSNFLCRKCHTSRTSNTTHNTSDHDGYSCERCHIRIPHGWKRPRLLRQSQNDPAPYNNTGVSGLAGISAQNYGGDVQENDCDTNCGDHGSNDSTPWWP